MRIVLIFRYNEIFQYFPITHQSSPTILFDSLSLSFNKPQRNSLATDFFGIGSLGERKCESVDRDSGRK